jgi:hypothetical protein
VRVIDEGSAQAERLARRRSLLNASAIANAVLSVEFLRFWWLIVDDLPTRAAGPLFVLVIIFGCMHLISMIVERSFIGEFPLAAWVLASGVPVAVGVIVGRTLGGVDLVVCVGLGLVGVVLASMAFRRGHGDRARWRAFIDHADPYGVSPEKRQQGPLTGRAANGDCGTTTWRGGKPVRGECPPHGRCRQYRRRRIGSTADTDP